VEHDGTVDAVIVSFLAQLCQDVELEHRPRLGETSSWDASVWFLPDGIEVRSSDRLLVDYRFGVAGEADGLRCALSPRRPDRLRGW